MNKRLISLLVVMMLLITACTPSLEDRQDQGDTLLRNRSYEEAIEVFEAMLDEDPHQYEAWHSLVKALIRNKQYSHAEAELNSYFVELEGDYGKDPTIDYRNLVKDVVRYARDLQSKGERMGSWYDVLNPPLVDLSYLPDTFEPGDTIELELPEGVKVYWTMDGSVPDVTDETQAYTAPLTIDEEGEYTLTVVAANDYGIQGPINSYWISSYASPQALIPSIPGGSYEGSVQIFFSDFDYDTMDLQYTTDGSDPVDFGMYYDEYNGITLPFGDYVLRAYYYDYNTGINSKETYAEYFIVNPYQVSEYTDFTVALFGQSEWVQSEIEYALDDIGYTFEDIDIYYYTVDDLETLKADLASGYAQAVYCASSYVEDLAFEDLIAPVMEAYDLEEEAYYSNALDAGFYNGAYYTLPVTINPNMMLYYNSLDVSDSLGVDIDTWDQLVEVANEGTNTYNFLYPEDISGEWVFSYYLGFGGTIGMNDNGGYDLDEGPLMDAMNFAYNLPTLYGLGYEGMDSSTYLDGISYSEATMIYGDLQHMIEYDIDSYYVPAGAMPLPNGYFAGSVNLVDGLHVVPSVLEDNNRYKVSQQIYDYMGKQFYANYIAGFGESLPAYIESVDLEYIYLYGQFEDYEHAVMNNVTLPYTYDLVAFFDMLTVEMQEVLYGSASIEEVTKSIVQKAGILFY